VWTVNGQIAHKQIVAVRRTRNNAKRRSNATADTSTFSGKRTMPVLARINLHRAVEERVGRTTSEVRRERLKLYDRHLLDATPLPTMSNTMTSRIELACIWAAALA